MVRTEQEPAFLLHQRPFRDSSLLLDVLSRDHGRLALVARGARGARSRLKGILRPFMPLRMSWVLKRDLGTLTGAELDGPPLKLTGDALLSGYYVNELILNLKHRHDPQPEVFAAYREAVLALAAAEDPAPTLRLFEIELLRLLGYALNVEHEAGSDDDLDPDAHYEYRPEQGPVRVQRTSGPMVFTGAELAGIRETRFEEIDVLRCAGRLMRQVIHHHLGGRELKSRRVLVDLHKVRAGKARGA